MPRKGINVYQRKEGRWVAVIPPSENPEGKRLEFYGDTQQAALSKRKEAERRIEDGLTAKPSKQKIGDYLDDWLETCVKPNRSAGTYDMRSNAIRNHLKPAFGHKALEALTPGDLRSFYRKKLDDGLKPNTVQAIHSTLNVALHQAVRDRILRENVAKLVSPPAREKGGDRHFTPEEAKQFIEAAIEEPYGIFFIILLLTGLRKTELRSLTWEDVDFEKRQLLVRGTKTRHSFRTVPIMPELVEILRTYKPQQQRSFLIKGWEWKPAVFLFTSQREYGRWGEYRPNEFLDRILKKHGFRHITVHQLRHTTASILFETGADPKEVQEILGHATLAMTMDLYTHLLPERKQAAVDRLSTLFDGKKAG